MLVAMSEGPGLSELFAALVKVQEAIRPVKKSAKGQIGKGEYRYADLVAIHVAWGAASKGSGLGFTQSPSTDDKGSSCDTILFHSGGGWIHYRCCGPFGTGNKGINDLQAQGSAFSYLKRYALAAAIGVVTEHDDDGRSAGLPTDQKGDPRPVSGHTADWTQAARRFAVDLGKLSPPLRIDGVSHYLEERGKARLSAMVGHELNTAIDWLRKGASVQVDAWLRDNADSSLRHAAARKLDAPADPDQADEGDPDAQF